MLVVAVHNVITIIIVRRQLVTDRVTFKGHDSQTYLVSKIRLQEEL